MARGKRSAGVSDGSTEGAATGSQRKVGRRCTACGAVNTPQWREGPEGPLTLCNACGLKWLRQHGKCVPKDCTRYFTPLVTPAGSNPDPRSDLAPQRQPTPDPSLTEATGLAPSRRSSRKHQRSVRLTDFAGPEQSPPPEHTTHLQQLPGASADQPGYVADAEGREAWEGDDFEDEEGIPQHYVDEEDELEEIRKRESSGSRAVLHGWMEEELVVPTQGEGMELPPECVQGLKVEQVDASLEQQAAAAEQPAAAAGQPAGETDELLELLPVELKQQLQQLVAQTVQAAAEALEADKAKDAAFKEYEEKCRQAERAQVQAKSLARLLDQQIKRITGGEGGPAAANVPVALPVL